MIPALTGLKLTALVGGIGALCAAGLGLMLLLEKLDHSQTKNQLTSAQNQASALTNANTVQRTTIKALTEELAAKVALYRMQAAEQSKDLQTARETLARTQADLARHRRAADGRPGQYGLLHDRAHRKLTLSFQTLTCRTDCGEGSGGS